MLCHEFIEQAGAWMEGERLPTAVAHVEGCARCRGLMADLEGIENAASELPAVEPPARVWVALRNQLEAEGLIRQPAESWLARLFSYVPAVPRVALAGAYLAVLVVLAGVALYQGGRTDTARDAGFPPVGVSVPAELARASNRTAPQMHEHNPAVTASYRDNLALIDNFIALCEKTVRAEPDNELARDYLYGAYQQKAELLATMTERGAAGD